MISAAELTEIERLFAHKSSTSVRRMGSLRHAGGGGAASSDSIAAPPIEFLSPKRAQNIAICLTKVVAMPFDAMASCVVSLNAMCRLSRDDVAALQLISPTEEELTLARDVKRRLTERCAPETNAPADAAASVAAAIGGMRAGERFVVALLEVPHFERKLQVILLLLLFPQHVASIRASISQLHDGAHDLAVVAEDLEKYAREER